MVSRTWLVDRCIGAAFSGLAAGIGYALWVFFNPGRAGVDPMLALAFFWKWAVLAGVLFGLLGGPKVVIWFWTRLCTPGWELPFFLRLVVVVATLAAFLNWFAQGR